MTNVPPAIPIHSLNTARPPAEFTNPVIAVGIEAMQRTAANKTRDPYLSHKGPRTNRIAIVPPTPTIDDVQISFFVSPRLCLISGSNGETANQMKNATKKHLQTSLFVSTLREGINLVFVWVHKDQDKTIPNSNLPP